MALPDWTLVHPYPLFVLDARDKNKLAPVNPAARIEPLATGWQGLNDVAAVANDENWVGRALFRLRHAREGLREATLFKDGDYDFLSVRKAGLSEDYLHLRDNFLSVLRTELEGVTQTLVKASKASGQGNYAKVLDNLFDLARIHGNQPLGAEERIVFADLVPQLLVEVPTAEHADRNLKFDLAAGDKPLGVLYGPPYWVKTALSILLKDVADTAADNTEIKVIARQLPYNLSLVFKAQGRGATGAVSSDGLSDRPLFLEGGDVSFERVEIHLAFAILKRIGAEYRINDGGLGIEYVVEIPTGKTQNKGIEAKADAATLQAEQYAKDMAMLMGAVARKKTAPRK